MLGSAESTAAASDLFTVVDKAHHIFGRKAVPTRLMLDLAVGTPSADFLGPPRVLEPAGKDFQKRLERVIQTKYSPDGVVVTGDLQILQFRGRTAPYLDPGPGDATFQPAPHGEEGTGHGNPSRRSEGRRRRHPGAR